MNNLSIIPVGKFQVVPRRNAGTFDLFSTCGVLRRPEDDCCSTLNKFRNLFAENLKMFICKSLSKLLLKNNNFYILL